MPALTAADTIRILVATDNHVGYNERDPVRGDDSWKSFHEIMCMAKDRDVDMVLLAGDLFHENKPSRKSMYNVMRSIRMNCFGPKPCELEMLSDGSEHFDGTFGFANYEDPNLNVAIPVFSIHGNHDDPAGEGHLASLDILEMSGLINYYGRTPESDNINVKPVLLQKGRTKLALYGLSNVRDERMYRTFRDGKVKFFQPDIQTEDWFNLICVHQNHHAHTETSYLPENFLPEFLDLVIWGHEHECDIQPHYNPEMNFRVMQPGSSVATSLIAAEAAPKHVAIISITGREFKSEPIRLKTVRPFIYKDLILADQKEAVKIAKKESHRTELTRFLMHVVDGLIDQAKKEWQEAQNEQPVEEFDDNSQPNECPLPLIRLRVEITPPEGVGRFDCENPQRFSNRFVEKVANTSDVIQFYTKKKASSTRQGKGLAVGPDAEIMSRFQGQEAAAIRVEQLVREFLAAQSLTILPQNYFGDAVSQFIDKDDRHAMEIFVNESLANQIKHLVNLHKARINEDDEGEEGVLAVEEEVDEYDEDAFADQIEQYRAQLEEMFTQETIKMKKAATASGRVRYKPKPDTWDSDLDGSWEDQPGALLRPDDAGDQGDEFNHDEDEEEAATPASSTTAGRGVRGRGRGSRAGRATTTSTRGRGSTATRKPTSGSSTRGKKKVVESDDDEDEDILMIDDDDDDDENSQSLFYREDKRTGTRGRKAASTSRTKQPAASTVPKTRQSRLNFTNSQNSVLGGGGKSQGRNNHDIEDDDDDDDAFEPVSSSRARK